MASSSFSFVGVPKHIARRRGATLPLSRVELHVHLDGSPRPDTIWELSKGTKFQTASSLRDLISKVSIDEPKNLSHFLLRFNHFLPVLRGNLVAIKQIATEFCEDMAANGVLYVEARYCPQLMAEGGVTAEHVVVAVTEGFELGQKLHGVKARSILCCISGLSIDVFEEVLRLCIKFRDKGVVGIDLAGDETSMEGFNEEKKVFSEAKRLGIHRTVHAGETGPARNVLVAVEDLHAERIGHGYRVLDDPQIYKTCLERNVHFETCPTSSLLTGAVDVAKAASFSHPVLEFVRDEANFSINSDDPTVTGTYLDDEFQLVRSWGLSETHLVRATFNAARASFLPGDEKAELLAQLRKVYGVE